jgi:hypothetical protein
MQESGPLRTNGDDCRRFADAISIVYVQGTFAIESLRDIRVVIEAFQKSV